MAGREAGADLLGPILGPTLPFAAVGLLTAVYWAYHMLSFAFTYARPSRLGRYLHHGGGPAGGGSGDAQEHGQTQRQHKGQQRPPWALVTGASDGIGRHLATELAGFGFNVVLHGRNPAKLAKVEEALVARFPSRKFRTLIVDVSRVPCPGCCKKADIGAAASASPAPVVDFASIAAQLADLHLTVVINNAGGALHDPSPFCGIELYSPESLAANVSANASFPLILTSVLMPRLVAAAPALIVNTGSMSDQAMPRLPSYAPAKAFLNCMSASLALDAAFEGGSRGQVEVMCVRVGDSTGTSHQGRKAGLFVPDAGTVARCILARVGCGRPVVVPYFWHAVQDIAANLLPHWLRSKIIIHVIRQKVEEEKTGLA